MFDVAGSGLGLDVLSLGSGLGFEGWVKESVLVSINVHVWEQNVEVGL